jgi:hypothetical protein
MGWISNHGDSARSVYSMSSFAVHISISAQDTALFRSGDNHRVAGFATILVDPVSEIERERDGAESAGRTFDVRGELSSFHGAGSVKGERIARLIFD